MAELPCDNFILCVINASPGLAEVLQSEINSYRRNAHELHPSRSENEN